MWQHKLNKG